MNESEKEKNNFLLPILKGTIISFLLTIIMIFIISILLCNTNLNESVISPFIIFSSSFSLLIGSFFTTKKIEKNGIMYGGILGLIYILIIYLISSILNSNFILNLNSVILIISGIMCGAIGRNIWSKCKKMKLTNK